MHPGPGSVPAFRSFLIPYLHPISVKRARFQPCTTLPKIFFSLFLALQEYQLHCFDFCQCYCCVVRYNFAAFMFLNYPPWCSILFNNINSHTPSNHILPNYRKQRVWYCFLFTPAPRLNSHPKYFEKTHNTFPSSFHMTPLPLF